MKDRVTITIDADVLSKIEKLCAQEDRTVSNMINMMLKQMLANMCPNTQPNSHEK